MKSLNYTSRIDALDYLRGFALIGIILVNILALLAVPIPAEGTWDATYQRFLYLFVEGRFFTIFSFLFGVGFYLFISRAIAKGDNGYVLFLRRIVVLFVFGVVHFLFQPGEALTIYAICGLLILPFYKVRKEMNLVIGLSLLLLFSVFSAKLLMTFPIILLGLTAGQYRIFENLSENKRKLTLFTFVMFVLSVIGITYQYLQMPAVPFENMILGGIDDPEMLQSSKFLSIGIMIGPIVSAFYVGLFLLVLNLPFFHKALSPLKSYGRMALTNYVFQTVLILIAGHALNLFQTITYLQSFYLCFAIYIIQLLFSTIWLKYFKFGPLEWIWRMITYFERIPLKNK